ncbi:50S ribosomal protein L11 methyltransferase [Thiomicrospira cyclica]|uniref:Ribosomal protein L11 methyltransferase n=1 Tax=Thiomicrospira cyclica (strain DSM 14477 / JCM 11371 / ALM1) TaxID=717773 RepID=F6DAS5_THICA|nr:50S ribosomal protein L11 methyltransferase [Thiomicrospira cyclica]AEG31168.1 Ribosomal protein L11 methyltransferase [Thiomicrospira cyclica ALM1]
MAWIQITSIVAETEAEPLSDALMELGALSVTFAETGEQEIFEPDIGTTPIWQQTRVLGLFDAQINSAECLLGLTQLMPELSPSQFKVELIEDKDWVREWMDQFQPMLFGENLWIVPSWLPAPNPAATNLLLDPGLAFGTGTHPTTAMCLGWLDNNPPVSKSVIDYGCGSGILAIAAAKLGASSVFATDIDPQAITATLDNAQRNQVNLQAGLVKEIRLPTSELILANILAGPLAELAPILSQHLQIDGQLVLSGLLVSQAETLIACYQDVGIHMQLVNQHEDWALLVGVKTAKNP